MPKIEVTDIKGKKKGEADLSEKVFSVQPNITVMHEVVRAQRNARRAGTQQTKNRSAVSGGGKKPFRQKGTGRARQGTTRAPQYRGGGVVFGPSPRSYAFKVNNKEVKLAMRSALSAKFSEGALHVVDGFDFKTPHTKDAAAALAALGITGRVTIIVADDDVNSFLSFRNIPTARTIAASEANAYDLIDNSAVLMTSDALKHVEEVLS